MTKTDRLAKVKWTEIESECGDYRTGFIATFRKYEGQLTDEKDAQGRAVKVTATSFARHMGIAERSFLRWVDQDRRGGGPAPADANRNRTAETLRDPKARRHVIAELEPAEVDAVIKDANDVAVERLRAKRAEHDTTPKVRDLMDPADPFKPDEFWADTVVIRIKNNALELASLIQRGGGLLFGAMEYEKAFEYLSEAERLIAEARAAAQEQIRDQMEVS